jgi:small neutral amino acid transporter SnatA (MarC family)
MSLSKYTGATTSGLFHDTWRKEIMSSLKNFTNAEMVTLIVGVFWAAAAFAQTSVAGGVEASPVPAGTQALMLSPGKIFTYFMVMLGPLKLLGPFLKIAAGMDRTTSQRLALRGFVIACLAGLAAAFIGRSILGKWGISLAALLLTAGLVLLLVALKAVMSEFAQAPEPPAAVEPPRRAEVSVNHLAFSPLAFPNIMTPYGSAVLILLATVEKEEGGLYRMLGIFLVIMVLDLAAMWFARPILKYCAGILTLLGAVLGVLQVALAVQMLLLAGRMLHVLP